MAMKEYLIAWPLFSFGEDSDLFNVVFLTNIKEICT